MIEKKYDITDQKESEQQKEDFIVVASHELKTPLTTIKAYTELLQEMCNAGDYASGAPLVKKLSAQVDRLIVLVHALLDTTKIADGGLPLHMEEFDLKKLVKESAENLQQTTKLCHIIVQPQKKILINADRERIGQALNNLISNAIKYSPNGGNIIVNYGQTEEGVEVSVRDEGVGISKEMRAKVFDLFFRVNDAKANTFPGMGLGLYITYNIIQRHGGKIWVEGEQGKGSVFYFIIPYNKRTP